MKCYAIWHANVHYQQGANKMSQFDIRKWKSSLNESQQSENKRMTEE